MHKKVCEPENALLALLPGYVDHRQSVQLKKLLQVAMQNELTPQQLRCISLYYGRGMTMRDVGERLGIHASTVSRNIRRGTLRLQRALRYAAGNFSM